MYKNHKAVKNSITLDYNELRKANSGNAKAIVKKRKRIRTETMIVSKKDWNSAKKQEINALASEDVLITHKVLENSVVIKLEFYKPKEKGPPGIQNPPGAKKERQKKRLQERIYKMARAEMVELLKTKSEEQVKFIIENKYEIKL